MKFKSVLFLVPLGIVLSSCWYSPDIDLVEEETRDDVERLLTEDNNKDTYCRLDRYFLSEHPDDLTYTGFLKGMYFYNNRRYDFNRYKFITFKDSTKFYRNVVVKFRDKNYDHFVISISADSD